MKLRIQDNSVRLRLTRSEVEKLATDGRVEGSVQFGVLPNDTLTYALVSSPACDEICARRGSNEICVTLPQKLAHSWAMTDRVAVEHLQLLGSGAALHILVEKDFRCAHRGADAPDEENAADLYPNLNETLGSRQ